MGADVFLAGGGAAQSLQRRFRQELREDKGKKEWNCSLEKKERNGPKSSLAQEKSKDVKVVELQRLE